jgi:hypothetical protein
VTSVVNRYYDPTTGMFFTVDPDVMETGQSYAYAGDDPVNMEDPSGTITCPSWLPGCGVVTDAQNAIAGSFKAAVQFVDKNASSISAASGLLAAVALSIPVVGEVASPILGAVSVVTGAIATSEDIQGGNDLQAALDSLGTLLGGAGLGVDEASRLTMVAAQEAWDAGEAVVDLARTTANEEKISALLTRLSAAISSLSAVYSATETHC